MGHAKDILLINPWIYDFAAYDFWMKPLGLLYAAAMIRRHTPHRAIMLGGIHATLCPGHARAESGADLVVPGPAEEGLLPALAGVLGGASADAPDPSTPDSLPPPAFDLLRDRRWLPVLTSRGCPLRCPYRAGRLLSSGFKLRPPAAVLAEIRDSHARFGTRHFAFYDDALLWGKREHAWPLFEGLAAAGVYLITGLPGQSKAGVAESIRFVRGLGAVPRIAHFSPIPGTAEWAALVRAGTLDDDADPLLHNKTAFAYLKSGLPPGDLEALLRAPA